MIFLLRSLREWLRALRPGRWFGLGLIALALGTAVPADAYGDWVYGNLGPGVHDNLELIREKIQSWPQPERERYQTDRAYIWEQIRRAAKVIPTGKYPVHTLANGSWMLQDHRVWVAGHWVGMLWLAHRQTGQAEFREWAGEWAEPIAKRRNETWTHDHGFLFGLSFIKGSEMSGDPKTKARYREIALAAARAYILKANPITGFISWHDTYREKKGMDETVIDSMMDVELMWWATEQTGDPRFVEAGLKQVEAVRQYLVRSDFSTAHGFVFDPKTGGDIRQQTFQGYAADSCWSRGQAWAIYGFAQIYAKTGNKEYLKTARGVADFFLRNLPADQVPYWDFDAPKIPREQYPNALVRDSSAAAIAASGLLDLARFEDDPALAGNYLDASRRMLASLSAPEYLTRGSGAMGIIRHGCQFFKRQDRDPDNIDSCNIWGDYYYMEALDKLERWGRQDVAAAKTDPERPVTRNQ